VDFARFERGNRQHGARKIKTALPARTPDSAFDRDQSQGDLES